MVYLLIAWWIFHGYVSSPEGTVIVFICPVYSSRRQETSKLAPRKPRNLVIFIINRFSNWHIRGMPHWNSHIFPHVMFSCWIFCTLRCPRGVCMPPRCWFLHLQLGMGIYMGISMGYTVSLISKLVWRWVPTTWQFNRKRVGNCLFVFFF